MSPRWWHWLDCGLKTGGKGAINGGDIITELGEGISDNSQKRVSISVSGHLRFPNKGELLEKYNNHCSIP